MSQNTTHSDDEWNTLIEILRGDPEEDDIFAAAEQLRATNDPACIPQLYELVREPGNFWLRELAAEPLARLEGIRALPALLEAQQLGEQERHDNDSLNLFLVELVEAYPEDAAQTLRHILSDSQSPLRHQAVWPLGFLPTAIALVPLLQALNDADPEIRREVAWALGSESFATSETISALLRSLQDPAETVRAAAAYSLGYLSTSDAAPPTLQGALMGLPGSLGEAARQGITSRARFDPK